MGLTVKFALPTLFKVPFRLPAHEMSEYIVTREERWRKRSIGIDQTLPSSGMAWSSPRMIVPYHLQKRIVIARPVQSGRKPFGNAAFPSRNDAIRDAAGKKCTILSDYMDLMAGTPGF